MVLLVHNFYRSYHIGGEDLVFQQELADLRSYLGEERVFTYTVSNDAARARETPEYLIGHTGHEEAMCALIAQYAINIVHVHNFFPQLHPRFFQKIREAGVRIFHTLHNYRWWCPVGTFYRDGPCFVCRDKALPWPAVWHSCMPSIAQGVFTTVALGFYHQQKVRDHIDRFIYLSKTQYTQLQSTDISLERCRYKPNAIDFPAVITAPENKKGYLYVGRLEAQKGIHILLETWRTLPVSFVLTVIGTGDIASLQAQYAMENVHFLGKRTPFEVQAAMQSARVLIHPSLMEETFGLTILEAMAVGTPVIGFPIGTRAEFITSEYNGWLSRPEILGKTILMSANDVCYGRISAQARNFAQPYARERIINTLISYYQEALDE